MTSRDSLLSSPPAAAFPAPGSAQLAASPTIEAAVVSGDARSSGGDGCTALNFLKYLHVAHAHRRKHRTSFLWGAGYCVVHDWQR